MDVLKSKFFKLFFAAALILSVTGLASAQTSISSCQDFKDIENSPSDDYVLTQDIDCGGDQIQINGFDGSLDGDGYTISNWEVDNDLTEVGDFGVPGLIIPSTSSSTEYLNVSDITFADGVSNPASGDDTSAIFGFNDEGENNHVDIDGVTVRNIDINADYDAGTSGLVFAEMDKSKVRGLTVESVSASGVPGFGTFGIVRNDETHDINGVTISDFNITDSPDSRVGILIADGDSSVTLSNIQVYDSNIDNVEAGAVMGDGGTVSGLLIDNVDVSAVSGGWAGGIVSSTSSTISSGVKVIDSSVTGNSDLTRGVGILAAGGSGGGIEDAYVLNSEVNENGGSAGVLTGDTFEYESENVFIAESPNPDNLDLYNDVDTLDTSGNYYDTDTTDIPSSSYATGLTTSEMTGSSAETNMPEYDFDNVWATQDNDYPELRTFILSDPGISLNNPEDGSELTLFSDTTFDFDVTTNDEEVDVQLELTKPDDTTETLLSDTQASGISSENYQEIYTLNQAGSYNWTVSAEGMQTSASESRSFSVPQPDAPEFSLNSPVGETIESYDSQDDIDFDFEVQNADISGNYTLQLKNSSSESYENVAEGSYSSGNNSFTETVSVDYLSPGTTQDKDWRVEADDDTQVETSNSETFTAERWEEPEISIEVPENNELFYIDEGETVEVPFEGWVNNSQESGEAFASSEKFEEQFDDSIGSVNTGDQYVQGDLLVNTGEFTDSKIRVDFNSGASFESDSITFKVKDGTPTIDSFNVSSDEVQNLENVEPGDFFDFTLEGTKTADDIDSIEYNVDVSGETDPSPVTLNAEDDDFYQDSNIFTNSLDDAFEMEESWAGSTLEFDVTVTDTEGRTQTETETVQTGTPPNEFLLNSPSVGEFFLIPEGQNDTEVEIDYGVDSSELSGDLKLYVNDAEVASDSVGSNTEETFTYSDRYEEGTQTWYLEWTDSNEETYTSSSSNFEVSQYPVGLSLDSPSEGEEVQIPSDPGTVDHDFTVSSDAFTGDWYYTLQVEDGNGTQVDEITSTTYSGVEEEFTETVDGIEEGSYTYNVSVLDASDDSEIISKEKSYTTNFDPVFNQEIDSPGDGNTYLVEEGETRNVSYGFSVETFDDATDFTLSLDGNDVTTESVGTQTSETFTGDFTDLGTGDYNIELSGEDESGRTNTTEASFSVEEADSENESVEINTIEFSPNLDEARPGDELDVYIEGSGVPENVDFVEIELDVAGDVETITVPTDELQEGSWSWNGENVATVKESWAGATAKVTGTVTDVKGSTSRFFREYVLGENIEMFGNLENPTEGDVFKQESGEEVNIPFRGSATAGFDEITYNIEVNDQNLLGGNLGPEESEDFGEFFQVSDWTQDSYGEFDAQLVLTNDVTNTKKTYSNSFEIVEDTGQPVVSISDPRQSQEIEPPRNEDDAEVTLRYSIQTNETGTTSLVLENLDEGRQEINIDNIDSEVSESEADSGEAIRTADIELDEATYLMRAEFEDSTGQTASREITFTVTSDPIEPEEDEEVRLIEPEEGEEIAKNVGTKLRWYAIHGQNVATPTSTFYVEDSSDTVVFNTTKDAPQVGNKNIYSEYLDANLEPGNYQFYADLALDNETLETEKRNLTILDSQAPKTDLQNQDLGTFRQNEEGLAEIEAEFTTETFQQDATVELVTRRKGTNDREVVFSTQQQGFREVMHNASWDEFTAGQYEYYVRMEANPTYTSDTGTYTVEETSFDEPLIELDRPEQGETFTYNDTNASVPFRFDAEAYSQGQTNFTVLLETVSEDNSELESIDSFTLSEEDGLLEYSENFDLEESGYRYQVIAEYEDETWSSDTRSFVVDNEETAETPDMPTAEEGFGILSRISDFGERLLGDNSDFILGFALLMVTSVGVTIRSRSDKIGLATMVAIALGLSYVGVFPSWIAAVFTLISVGISVWTVNLLVGGKGEL